MKTYLRHSGTWIQKLNSVCVPVCSENSKSNDVPWKLLAIGPLSCVQRTEPPCPEMQIRGCRASPQFPLRSLSRKYCENRENLLHFDQQAPDCIPTSPTYRRLRGNGCGTWHSLPQQETLDVPTRKEPGSGKDPAGSPCYLSRSLPGSPRILHTPHCPWCSNRDYLQIPKGPSPHLAVWTSSPVRSHTTLNACNLIWALPLLQPISGGSLSQASLPQKEAPHRPALPCGLLVLSQYSKEPPALVRSAAKQDRSLGCHITPKARGSCDGRQHRKSLLRGHTLFRTCCL